MKSDILKVAEDSARGGFFLISGTALSTIILAIASIFIGRILGPDLYGQYTLATVVSQLLFLFTDLGINQGVIKFTATLNQEGQTDRITKIIRYALLLKVAAGIILFTANYALADAIAVYFLQRPDLSFYIRIASTSVLFQAIFATATSTFVGLDRTEYNALVTNVQALAKTGISILLVLLGLGVSGAVIGYSVSYFVAAISGAFALFLVLRAKQETRKNQSAANDLRALARYGAPLYISVLLTGLVPLFNNFMLANFATDADIGNYKAAINFATLMSIFSIPIATSLLSAFSKIESRSDKKIRDFFRLANKYTSMLTIPITVLIIVYSGQIVHVIYGSTYRSAPTFLSTYCFLYFLMGFGYLTLASFYNGLGDTRTTLRISLTTFVALIALSPLLTRVFSVQGLIAAFLIASTIGTFYGLHMARKRYQVEYDSHSLLKIYMIAVVSIVPSFLIFRIVPVRDILSLAAGGLLYLSIYATLLPLTKTITPHELQIASRITRKIPLLAVVAKPVLRYEERILNARTKSNP